MSDDDDDWKSLRARLDALKSNQAVPNRCDAPADQTRAQISLENESLAARFDAVLGSNRISKGVGHRRKKCVKTETEEVEELMQAAFEHAQLERGHREEENKSGSDAEEVAAPKRKVKCFLKS